MPSAILSKDFATPGGKRRRFARKWPCRYWSFPSGLYLGRSGVERALLVSPMLLILVVEILNSAVEAVVDRSGTERHPLAGMAKDMGSAAVMLSFALLGTVWFLILSDHGH